MRPSETFLLCRPRINLPTSLSAGLRNTGKQEHTRVMGNKSISKCIILKWKNVYFPSHKIHAVPPCCASE